MIKQFSRAQICMSSARLLLVTKLRTFHPWIVVRGANGEIIVKESLKATAMAFGLAILCGSLTWGCAAATNSVVHNKANSARQNKDNQTAAVASGDAFFTVRNNKVVATSATAPVPARNSTPSLSSSHSRGSSLNHWQLE
jgi:hypothetical protein